MFKGLMGCSLKRLFLGGVKKKRINGDAPHVRALIRKGGFSFST